MDSKKSSMKMEMKEDETCDCEGGKCEDGKCEGSCECGPGGECGHGDCGSGGCCEKECRPGMGGMWGGKGMWLMWAGYGILGAGIWRLGMEAGLWDKLTPLTIGLLIVGGVLACAGCKRHWKGSSGRCC